VNEEEFENIIIRAGADGEITRLKDIARVELGSSQYALRSLLNNQPAVAIPIFQRPGSNAIEISDEVRAKMAELKKDFPEGMDYSIVYGPTIFVRGSIEAVVHTLFEALVLVVLVVIVHHGYECGGPAPAGLGADRSDSERPALAAPVSAGGGEHLDDVGMTTSGRPEECRLAAAPFDYYSRRPDGCTRCTVDRTLSRSRQRRRRRR
jgi:hypothetical protein